MCESFETRLILSYYDLSEEWQEEAINNLGESAKDASYLEPAESETPDVNILYDLENVEGCEYSCTDDGFYYNAYMPLTNTTAVLLDFCLDGTARMVVSCLIE